MIGSVIQTTVRVTSSCAVVVPQKGLLSTLRPLSVHTSGWPARWHLVNTESWLAELVCLGEGGGGGQEVRSKSCSRRGTASVVAGHLVTPRPVLVLGQVRVRALALVVLRVVVQDVVEDVQGTDSLALPECIRLKVGRLHAEARRSEEPM